jgi:hypothetical protein
MVFGEEFGHGAFTNNQKLIFSLCGNAHNLFMNRESLVPAVGVQLTFHSHHSSPFTIHVRWMAFAGGRP